MRLAQALHLSRRPAAAFVAMGAAWGAFAALIPELKAQIGASDALFGAIIAVSAIGLALAMLLAPWFDRRAGALSMPFAAMTMAAAFLVPGLAADPAVFATAMLVVACATGTLDIVMNARVSELEAQASRALMNLNHAMFSFAYAGSAALTGLAREAQWPPVAVFALIALFSLALASTMRMAAEAEPAGSSAPAGLPLGVILWGGLIVMAAFMTESSIEGWSALHVERTLGGGAAQGALGPAMLGLTMGVGRLAGHVLSNRIAPAPLIASASVLAALGALIAAAAPTPLAAYAGFGIAGLGVSVIAPTALAIVGAQVGSGSRTTAISRVAVIGFSGFFIGPPMMGLISEFFGLRVAFAAIAGVLGFAMIALFQLKRRT